MEEKEKQMNEKGIYISSVAYQRFEQVQQQFMEHFMDELIAWKKSQTPHGQLEDYSIVPQDIARFVTLHEEFSQFRPCMLQESLAVDNPIHEIDEMNPLFHTEFLEDVSSTPTLHILKL